MSSIYVPKLAVLTGYPSSGKSSLSEILEKEFGFKHISSDNLREEMYGMSYEELKKDPFGERKEQIMHDTLQRKKDEALRGGLDVVLDTTAPNKWSREKMLKTRPGYDVDKYLMYLKVDREILTKRNLERGRKDDVNKVWDKFWQEPEERPGEYSLIVMPNNTKEDFDKMYEILAREFSKMMRK